MANVSKIIGYNKTSSTNNKLLAIYGNDVVNVDTGAGFGLNIADATKADLEVYLDRVFLQQYKDVYATSTDSTRPKTYDGSAWTTELAERMPLASLIKSFKERLYLADISFCNPQPPAVDTPGEAANIKYASKIFHTNLPVGENKLIMGLEWGTNGIVTAGDNLFRIAQEGKQPPQDFVARGIRVGDPLFITRGYPMASTSKAQTSRFTVASISTPYSLRTIEKFEFSRTDVNYWVGSNWFDVGTSDNDYITAFGENDDKLLFFKRFSLWRYNLTSLQKVKDAPGTTSPKSVVNVKEMTLYFHGSNTGTRKTGFYGYDGARSNFVSRAIQPYIDGISASNYPNVVAWREGNKYRAFVGDITNTPRNISVTNAVITIDVEGGQFSIDPIGDVIKSSGRFIESNAEKIFVGNDSGEVMETPSGNTHNGDPISWAMEIGPRFPAGSEIINEFTRIMIRSRGGRYIQVAYKLLGTPDDDDDQWLPLGDLKSNNQELFLPSSHHAGRGIDLRLSSQDSNANDFVVEKMSIFYIPKNVRNVV